MEDSNSTGGRRYVTILSGVNLLRVSSQCEKDIDIFTSYKQQIYKSTLFIFLFVVSKATRRCRPPLRCPESAIPVRSPRDGPHRRISPPGSVVQ